MRTLCTTRIALALGLAAALGACDNDKKPALGDDASVSPDSSVSEPGDDAGDAPEPDGSADEPDASDGAPDGGTSSLEQRLLGADLIAPDPTTLERDLMLPDDAFLPADLLPPG